MPKFNVTAELFDVTGAAIPYRDQPRNMTLRLALLDACTSMTEHDKNLNGEEKVKLDQLARRIFKNDECELSYAEITQLQTRADRVWGITVYAEVTRLFSAPLPEAQPADPQPN